MPAGKIINAGNVKIRNLDPGDYVGISFWLISIALASSTGFFALERFDVPDKWKTSLSVCAMITGIAATHYYYMRGVWIGTGKSPITYRYIDWFLTVPSNYRVLSHSIGSWKIPVELFYKLMGASVLMILFGFLGETRIIDRMVGFSGGMVCWLYILYSVFYGEAAELRKNTDDPGVKFAFDWLRIIVSVGWAIYPIGYLLGNKNMNLLYNLGDLVNKILFCVVIWYGAKHKSLIK